MPTGSGCGLIVTAPAVLLGSPVSTADGELRGRVLRH
jgi:hypothetical protein